MIGSLPDLRSRFRSWLAAASTLERIGVLAGSFFLVYLPVEAAGGIEGSALGFILRAIIMSVAWGAGMHYAEKKGFLGLSFDPSD